MINKIKTLPALATIFTYLQNTNTARKILDFSILGTLFSLVGIITGKIPLPTDWGTVSNVYFISAIVIIILSYLIGNKIIQVNLRKNHTVEQTCKVSEEVSRILVGEQYNSDYSFIGHFRFHNGVSGIDGFNFMKCSLTEYANAISVNVDPMIFQNLPIIVNMHMVSALIDGIPYSSHVSPQASLYLEISKLNIKSYTAVAIRSKQGNLCGFIYVGSSTEKVPDSTIVKRIAEKVQSVGK